ncbi:MAG: hypothetical protein NC123_10410 [Butyrivibrio sp.]|nr:hypothetical protein [Acetatifactor muris]MCM1559941.1 hypothetical protein [Butyrivibrio sp.]
MLRRDESEITFEVTVIKREHETCVLRNFWNNGDDYWLHEEPQLLSAYVGLNDEKIAQRVWEETVGFWIMAWKADLKKPELTEEAKSQIRQILEAFESMEYDKVKKVVIRKN